MTAFAVEASVWGLPGCFAGFAWHTAAPIREHGASLTGGLPISVNPFLPNNLPHSRRHQRLHPLPAPRPTRLPRKRTTHRPLAPPPPLHYLNPPLPPLLIQPPHP